MVLALHLGLLAGIGVGEIVVQKGDSGAQRKWRKRCEEVGRLGQCGPQAFFPASGTQCCTGRLHGL